MSDFLYKIYQRMRFNRETNAYEVEFWEVHRLNTKTLEIFYLSNLLSSVGTVDIWLPIYPSGLINLSQMTSFLTIEEAIHFLEKNKQTDLSYKLMNHI